MAITLPELPYAMDALAPHISQETLEFHYGKHHASYVAKLAKQIEGTAHENSDLETIVRNSDSGVFNNAAQIWNHSFYWNCLSPNGGGEADGPIAEALNQSFGSFDAFKEAFTTSALTNFGSSWTWLVQNADDGIEIVNTSNAATPLTDSSVTPLLTVDMWEHAYYIDYRNSRSNYMAAFWSLVNWGFVNDNLA
jgi:superoxide dismutase, Fe-Mn family